jgi:uncharacterized protein (TIGR03067 family)
MIDGTWQVVHAELAGEAMPDFVAEKVVLQFANDGYEVRFDGAVTDRGTYAISEALDLGTLSLHGESGPNAGRTIAAIFLLRGDRLRVCYGLDGTPPTEFTTAAGQQRYLATYRRQAT